MQPWIHPHPVSASFINEDEAKFIHGGGKKNRETPQQPSARQASATYRQSEALQCQQSLAWQHPKRSSGSATDSLAPVLTPQRMTPRLCTSAQFCRDTTATLP